MASVLVTRAEAAARRTARAVADAGHEAVILPLITYRDTGAAIARDAFDAIVVTSAAAMAVLSARIEDDPRLGALRELPVFCVGEATARAAEAAGFSRVETAAGNAAALARLLADRFGGARRGAGAAATVLYLAGVDRAFDLQSSLEASGIGVVQAEIYRAELRDPGAAELARAVAACRDGAALLYSARSAGHLFAIAKRHGLGKALARLTFLAISENVAEAVPGRQTKRVLVAGASDEAALLRLLERLGGDDPDEDGKAFPGTEQDDAKSQ